MNFKDIIAKHALAQGIDWRGPEELEKDAGQIKMPNLNSKFTRPEQQVSTVKPGNKFADKKGKAAGFTDFSEAQQPDGGQFIPGDDPHSVVGAEASQSTKQHEGFHYLTNDLVKKHGINKIHKLYSELASSIHPEVAKLIDRTLDTNTDYYKMTNHPNKRYRLARLEEKINTLHDFIHGGADDKTGGRRAQLTEWANNNPGTISTLMGFRDKQHFDNELKSSWKRLRDKANAVKPEDL